MHKTSFKTVHVTLHLFSLKIMHKTAGYGKKIPLNLNISLTSMVSQSKFIAGKAMKVYQKLPH